MKNRKAEDTLDKLTSCYEECNDCNCNGLCTDQDLRDLYDYIQYLEEELDGIHQSIAGNY